MLDSATPLFITKPGTGLNKVLRGYEQGMPKGWLQLGGPGEPQGQKGPGAQEYKKRHRRQHCIMILVSLDAVGCVRVG